ncbi:hypothetical protein AYL99_11855 [Fonsecaea erecta]|uniref:Uncharacterized protein n=1 Tax=Fonsecaea erecta TaxID=1367422 RepID=A0A178Z4F1_9EURO|nr:hypothetical protein AYL99_11855 [Fonsecaea erecta]OAP53975.1 hypothetical protein AYL99_11855 [Fonsecaea erecta]
MTSPPGSPSPEAGLPQQKANVRSYPDQSHLAPADRFDQYKYVLMFADAVAKGRGRMTPDHPELRCDIYPESWIKLWKEEGSKFALCAEKRLFRFFYHKQRSLLTILPPQSHRHHAICALLMRLAYETKSTLTSTLADEMSILPGAGILEDKTSIMWGAAVRMNKNDYEPSVKQPDILIQWHQHQNVSDTKFHTVVEIGLCQPLDELQSIARLYFIAHTDIQRVVLIDIIETPQYELHKKEKFEDIGCFIDVTQKLRRDESTGVIWFGQTKIVGESMIIWEVWERDGPGRHFVGTAAGGLLVMKQMLVGPLTEKYAMAWTTPDVEKPLLEADDLVDLIRHNSASDINIFPDEPFGRGGNSTNTLLEIGAFTGWRTT